MNNFNFIKTDIPDLLIIEPKIYKDNRGYFIETYNKEEFFKAGIKVEFVQANESFSKKNVLRGMHFQLNYPQGKLVSVTKGIVFDVVVDLRRDSKTFGKSFSIVLSKENKKQLYIPPQFAHGFYVLSEYAAFNYKCTEFYHPEDECGIIWNDPDLDIKWPVEDASDIILSEKDKCWQNFKDIF